MNSACKGMTESHLGKCLLKDGCLRYHIHVDRPFTWAAHRQCRTAEYRFYLAEEPSEIHTKGFLK